MTAAVLLGSSPTEHGARARQAQPLAIKPIEGVTSISRLDGFFPDGRPGLFVFKTGEPVMGVYRYADRDLVYLRRAEPAAYVGKAIAYTSNGAKRLLVGYEYSRSFEQYTYVKTRNSPRDKITLVSYDENFENPEVLFEEHTAQGRINFLDLRSGKLFLHFSHLEEFSKGGYLLEQPDGKLALRREVAGRYQRSVDVDGTAIVVGSPFADVEERAEPLQLHRKMEALNLPSLRGVSSVRFVQLDSDPESEIVIGDGLANAQNKRARPQLSVIDFVPQTNSYRRTPVDTLSASQSVVEKIDRVSLGDELAVIIKGRRFLTLYRPAKGWEKVNIHRRATQKPEAPFDFVVLESNAREIVFAVLDGEQVKVMQYTL